MVAGGYKESAMVLYCTWLLGYSYRFARLFGMFSMDALDGH